MQEKYKTLNLIKFAVLIAKNHIPNNAGSFGSSESIRY